MITFPSIVFSLLRNRIPVINSLRLLFPMASIMITRMAEPTRAATTRPVRLCVIEFLTTKLRVINLLPSRDLMLNESHNCSLRQPHGLVRKAFEIRYRAKSHNQSLREQPCWRALDAVLAGNQFRAVNGIGSGPVGEGRV